MYSLDEVQLTTSRQIWVVWSIPAANFKRNCATDRLQDGRGTRPVLRNVVQVEDVDVYSGECRRDRRSPNPSVTILP